MNLCSPFIDKQFFQSSQVVQLYIMSKFYTPLGLFLIGFTDSISLRWVTEILFYTDRKTKKILKESIDLQKALLKSLIQAGLITTLLPIIVRWLGFVILGWILTGLSLIFTYTYLIFYNMDVTEKAMKVIVWKTQQHPDTMPQLDKRQKYNVFVEMSYLIQSFIFEMAYYTPMNLLLIIITLFEDRYFLAIMVIMDCFFNTAFYYFRKWPYDKYNVAFLEKNMAYSLGYGFFVSFVTNVLLPPSMSIGAYILLSQMMIINALCHTPPQKEFSSFEEIYHVLTNRQERRKLPSAYNIHRDRLNKQSEYRKKIMEDCLFMKPFFKYTSKINTFLQKNILKHHQPLVEPQREESPNIKSSFANSEQSTKITLERTDQQKPKQADKQSQVSSQIFVGPEREDSTVINLVFKSSNEGEQAHQKNK